MNRVLPVFLLLATIMLTIKVGVFTWQVAAAFVAEEVTTWEGLIVGTVNVVVGLLVTAALAAGVGLMSWMLAISA